MGKAVRSSPRPGRRTRGRLRAVAGGVLLGLVLFAVTLGTLELVRRDATPVRGPADPVAEWTQRTADSPDDPVAWAQLGIAIMDAARVNASPLRYPEAESALQRSLSLRAEDNPDAFLGSSMLAAARHHFADAYQWAVQAKAAGARMIAADAAIADALLELGRNEEAVAIIDGLAGSKPTFASYARVARARELAGDPAGAIRAMELALAASGSGQEAGFAATTLGQMHWSAGRVSVATSFFDAALRHQPGAGEAREGLANIAAAAGNLEFAITEYRAVASAGPDPHAAQMLLELLIADGRTAEAAEVRTMIGTSLTRLAALGVNVSVDAAILAADLGGDVAGPIRDLRREWEAGNRSAVLADALGWALLAAGDARGALDFARQALEKAPSNAMGHFHAGMIHRALGDRPAAAAAFQAALALNPNFSVRWAPVARAEVGRLAR